MSKVRGLNRLYRFHQALVQKTLPIRLPILIIYTNVPHISKRVRYRCPAATLRCKLPSIQSYKAYLQQHGFHKGIPKSIFSHKRQLLEICPSVAHAIFITRQYWPDIETPINGKTPAKRAYQHQATLENISSIDSHLRHHRETDPGLTGSELEGDLTKSRQKLRSSDT